MGRLHTAAGFCARCVLGSSLLCSCVFGGSDDEVPLPDPEAAVLASEAERANTDTDRILLKLTDTIDERKTDDLGDEETCEGFLANLDAEVDRPAFFEAVSAITDETLTELYLNLDAALASAAAVCRGEEAQELGPLADEAETWLGLIRQRREQLGIDS